jgi:hypothetical protein
MWTGIMNTGTRVLGLAVLIVFLLVFRFNVTVAPEWNVKVLDENGEALAGVYVSEFATPWTLNVHYEGAICSDRRGEAHFPRQTVRSSVLTRVSKFISGFGPHASLGPDVKIGVERLGYGDMPNESVTATWNGSATHVNSQFVLHKCPKGFSGYQCHFDDDYFFRVNSSAREMAACLSAQ